MDADQLDDPVLYRQELIKTHSRRLKALEIKASKYGLETPVSIEVEIVEIKEKIAALGGEIEELAYYRKLIIGKKKARRALLQSRLDALRNVRNDLISRYPEYPDFENMPSKELPFLWNSEIYARKVKALEDELVRLDNDDFDITTSLPDPFD